MPGVRVDLAHALRVTSAAHGRARELELEAVGLVAALAGDAAMKIGVRMRFLMTRAALARDGGGSTRGMRVVASAAGAARMFRVGRL